jgi:diguanylate cyclase (GGDEF)-like protein
LEHVILWLVMGIAAAATTAFFAGRALGRRSARTVAESSRRYAQPPAVALAPAAGDIQDERYRLLELLVNLPETINRMGAARSTQALCRITVRALVDLVGARRVGLFLAHGAPPRFRLEVFIGSPRPQERIAFALGEGKLGQLAGLIGVRSEGDLTVAARDETDADRLFGPELCVTIRRQDTIHAFVALDGVDLKDVMTRRIVQMLADIHAVSAEGLHSLHKERMRAEMDKLTGLFNRRHLDRRLAEEVARAQAYGLSLSIFLFDIDHFKHFNDTCGHQAGDECLKFVSAVTRKVTRGSDVVCRYGGEEFLVIFLGESRENAWRHAERIRAAIATSDYPEGKRQPLGVLSISGGVASFPDDGLDPASIVEVADRALYHAKATGRNRVLRPSDVPDSAVDEAARAAHRSVQASVPTPTPPGLAADHCAEAEAENLPFWVVRAAEPVHTPLPRLRADLTIERGVLSPIPQPMSSPIPRLKRQPRDLGSEGVYVIKDSEQTDKIRRK